MQGLLKGQVPLICRRGDVLQKYTILKSDHFPGELHEGPCCRYECLQRADRLYLMILPACAGCQNKKLLPLIDGAPNFRQVRRFQLPLLQT